jgi:thymidylate synthase (FAD)
MVPREVRLQDMKNRQNSIETRSAGLQSEWLEAQEAVWSEAIGNYRLALHMGVAKEVARALLPEGLTPSRLYMNGTVRSWVHYLKSRLDPSTQKEHRILAQQALGILREVAPITMAAFFPEEKS